MLSLLKTQRIEGKKQPEERKKEDKRLIAQVIENFSQLNRAKVRHHHYHMSS